MNPIPPYPVRPTPLTLVCAHQYLYYCLGQPIWSDTEYEQFCAHHKIEASGGSDCASSYTDRVKRLAAHMISHPRLYDTFKKPHIDLSNPP